MLFKINLYDSVTQEKFGDAMTGVCTLQKEHVAIQEPVRFSVTDEQLMEELQKRRTFQKNAE